MHAHREDVDCVQPVPTVVATDEVQVLRRPAGLQLRSMHVSVGRMHAAWQLSTYEGMSPMDPDSQKDTSAILSPSASHCKAMQHVCDTDYSGRL